MRSGLVVDWLLEQTLGRLVKVLHRAHLIRAVVIRESDRAAACWDAALAEAGDQESMSALVLLRALLHDPECGFVRFLVDEGADIAALRLRLQSVASKPDPPRVRGGAFAAMLRRSYEVVPVVDAPGRRDPEQELHTVHYLWGFATDPSHAAAALRGACPILDGLRRDSVPWSLWRDSGERRIG